MARAYLHDFMPAVRNQSDKSVAAYKQSLNSYLTFLESKKDLKEDQVTFDTFSRNNVKDFVEWLHEKKYAPKTINLKLTAIRSFLKYCADEDFELRGIYNDVCTVRKVKEEKKPIEYLQPEATSSEPYDPNTPVRHRSKSTGTIRPVDLIASSGCAPSLRYTDWEGTKDQKCTGYE